jgi:hypothetical protein
MVISEPCQARSWRRSVICIDSNANRVRAEPIAVSPGAHPEWFGKVLRSEADTATNPFSI